MLIPLPCALTIPCPVFTWLLPHLAPRRAPLKHQADASVAVNPGSNQLSVWCFSFLEDSPPQDSLLTVTQGK